MGVCFIVKVKEEKIGVSEMMLFPAPDAAGCMLAQISFIDPDTDIIRHLIYLFSGVFDCNFMFIIFDIWEKWLRRKTLWILPFLSCVFLLDSFSVHGIA